MHDHNKAHRVTAIQTFKMAPQKVYDAFLNPELIGQWMFGPKLREEKILHIQIDPKVGGKFSFLVERSGEKLDHIGEYIELRPYNRLVFTWSIDPHPPSYVYIDIDSIADGCELTLTHEIDPEWAAYADRIQDGWTKMLRVLATIPQ